MTAALGRGWFRHRRPHRGTRRRVRAFRWLAAGAAAPAAATSVLRAAPVDWPVQAVQLLAFVPWLTVPATAAFLLSLPARNRPLQLLTAAVLGVQVAWLIPPAAAGPATANAGGRAVPLRVMTLNAELGGADAGQVVRLVQDQQVDVLAVEEYTQDLAARLSAAGLPSLLPHLVSRPRERAAGGAVYSSFPLRDEGVVPGTRFSMPVVSLELGTGNGAALRVVAVHTLAPVGKGLDQWRSDLAAVAGADTGTGPLLLAGDFNATYDHREFRTLLAGTGGSRPLVDLAVSRGSWLVPTWPMRGFPLPGVTLDHLLASPDIRCSGYSVHRIEGTDHAAVVATLSVQVP